MTSKILISMLLTSFMSCGFASVSTLALRAEMIEKAFKSSEADAIKEINEKQQSSDTKPAEVKADKQNYVVVLKKQSDGNYMRVAHSLKDKINQQVEPVLAPVMTAAEEKLAGSNGPVDFEFQAGDNKLYAVIEKHGDCLVFNISEKKGEVIGFLESKGKIDTAVKATPTPAAEPKKESPKPVEKVESKKEEDKPAPIVNALASASTSASSTEEKIHTAPETASVSAAADVKTPDNSAVTAEALTEEKVHSA